MTRKSSKQLKFVAFIMSLVMLMTIAPFSAFAEDGVVDTSEAIDQVLSGDEIISDVKSAAVDNVVTLTAADVPEFIAMSDLTTRGTIRRVYEEEADLSTILFENNDGTRTLYMYGVPVKYVAPDGTTRDKSTAISSLAGLQALWNGSTLTPGQMTTLAQNSSIGRLELGQAAEALSLMNTRLIATYGATLKLSDMAYASLDSDIRSLYPTAVSDGVVLNYGDYSIRTIPIATGSLVLPGAANVAESTSLTDNDVRMRVRYSNAFGLGTILQYTPTTMGVKEEIILTSNVGKNSFSFRIETGGLTIEEENGNYYFFDPATQRVIAQLGEIIAYDSNGQIARGAVTVQSVIVGQRYNVTISVSPEFLANAAYPVSVDPTTTIYATNSAAIQYASLYNTAEAWGYTFESFHVFGTETSFSSYGPTFVGRALFRFPGFGDAFCDYGLISASQLASLELKLPTNANLSMSAHPAATSWTSGTRICDASMFNYYDISYSGGGSYSNGNIVVDLTSIAKMWLDCQTGANNYAFGSLSNGVIVMLDNESQYCTVTASEVSAVVDYTYSGYVGDFYFNNAYSHEFLINNGGTLSMGSYYISDSNPAGAITWEVEYLSNGEYAIHPNGSDVLYLAGNSSSPYILSSSTGVSSCPEARWTIEGGNQFKTANGYYLGVSSSGSLTMSTSFSNTSQKTWRWVSTSSYTQANSISIYIDGVLYNYNDTNQLLNPAYNGSDSATFTGGNANFTASSDYRVEIFPKKTYTHTGFATVSISGSTIVVNGVEAGETDVKITHIPTGLIKYIRVHVEPCGGNWGTFGENDEGDFSQHVFYDTDPDENGKIECSMCHLLIDKSVYDDYYNAGEDEEDPVLPQATKYDTISELIAAEAVALYNESLACGFEVAAGIVCTTDDKYIMSRTYHSNSSISVNIKYFEELSGVPDDSIWVGNIHSHPYWTGEKFSEPDRRCYYKALSESGGTCIYHYVVEPCSWDERYIQVWAVNPDMAANDEELLAYKFMEYTNEP